MCSGHSSASVEESLLSAVGETQGGDDALTHIALTPYTSCICLKERRRVWDCAARLLPEKALLGICPWPHLFLPCVVSCADLIFKLDCFTSFKERERRLVARGLQTLSLSALGVHRTVV